MSDVRQYVEENRGLVKKIELSIPGFHGYRIREDLRAADNILRCYIADQIEREIKKPIEEVGEMLTKKLELDYIGDVRECLNQIKKIEAKIRHAEHGYSGISPQFKIEEEELNKIYEFDLALINQLKSIQANAHLLENCALDNRMNELKKGIHEIKMQVRTFENAFDQRLSFIKISDEG